jgi:hypothetical protein
MARLWAALAAVLPFAGHANSCIAKDIVGGEGWINSTAKMKQVIDAKCTSIDFLWVSKCASCDQALWAQLDGITRITWKDPRNGVSFLLAGCPQITNIENLRSLKGRLEGGLFIEWNTNLTTLKGIEGVDGFGVTNFGRKVVLVENAQLLEAASLRSPNITATELQVHGNPMLSCTPLNWPARDCDGAEIPRGPCVTHAPTLMPSLMPSLVPSRVPDAKKKGSQKMMVHIGLGAVFVVAIMGTLLFFKNKPAFLKETKTVEDSKTDVLPLLFNSKTGEPIYNDVRTHSREKKKNKNRSGDSFKDPLLRPASVKNEAPDDDLEYPLLRHASLKNEAPDDDLLDNLDVREAELLGVVGEGSYGIVYRAKWQGTIVAMKVMKATADSDDSRSSDSEDHERLRREIRILKSTRHPNIIVSSSCRLINIIVSSSCRLDGTAVLGVCLINIMPCHALFSADLHRLRPYFRFDRRAEHIYCHGLRLRRYAY